MSSLILDSWSHRTQAATRALIVPDGCRDVIVQVEPGQAPRWFISPLDASVREAVLCADTFTQGFRLRAGAEIDEPGLLATLAADALHGDGILECIHAYCSLRPAVADALEALEVASSVVAAARELGVSTRSLERLLRIATEHPPVFWLQLARARRAARAVGQGYPLAELAFQHGFSDQPHMTRQFRRWFGVSPAALRTSEEINQALGAHGFG